jgi:hypothetical protein
MYQASAPLNLAPFGSSVTAALRPMVAMVPLSLYTNPVRGSPLSVSSMFWAACLASWMAGWATWGCSPPLPSGAPARSPTTNTSGRPGTLRSSPTTIRPPRVCSRPRMSASGWARTPAPQISVRVGITVPSLSTTSSGVARSSACPRRTSTPRLARMSRACRRELGWNGASRWSMASSSTTLAWLMSSSGKSWTSTCLNSSSRAPAISTPVGPPPTTTTVSAPLSISLGSFSASSNWRSRWARSRSASGMLLSGKLCSSTPGIPKVAVVAPAARIR